jgi:radical SAM protein with 4Fe4S-binding SPASM domain
MSTGDLYSCSAYLLDDRFNLGNITYDTFQKVWEGEKRRANWEYITKELNISECRVNCRMARSNEYLAQFGNVPHSAFI